MANEETKNIGMEAQEKKTAEPKKAPEQKEKGSLVSYFTGVRTEMKKVVWPTKKELSSYTAVTLIICAFFALAFWAVDSGFLALLRAVLNIEL